MVDLFTITTTSTYRIRPFNRAPTILQTGQQEATILQTALGELAAQEESVVQEGSAVPEESVVPEDLAAQAELAVREDQAAQAELVVREDQAAQAELAVREDQAAQAELVVREDQAAQAELVVPQHVLTIHQWRGHTPVGRLTFPARARFPTMGKSATPTAGKSATRQEIRRGIRPHDPPAAIGLPTIDPRRRVALATRRADTAAERMPGAVAVVRSVVINLAELRNATVTADAPVWAAAEVAEEAAAEVVEEAAAEVVEEAAEVVEEAAEVVEEEEGAADDAKPGRKSTQSAQKPLTIWSG